MQAIMESFFCIAYLVITSTLGALMIIKAHGNRPRILFSIMTLVLVFGDAFHLIPRISGLLTDTIVEITDILGFGTFVPSITMTVFYVMLYHFWCLRYSKPVKSGLTITVYILAICRIALCLFPQNDWLSSDAPLIWGIYRNIPFTLLGAIIVILFFIEARKNNDKAFRWAWLAIMLSFLFYLPVVLWSVNIPMIGMLMIPKTICYVWLVLMGYNDRSSYGKK